MHENTKQGNVSQTIIAVLLKVCVRSILSTVANESKHGKCRRWPSLECVFDVKMITSVLMWYSSFDSARQLGRTQLRDCRTRRRRIKYRLSRAQS